MERLRKKGYLARRKIDAFYQDFAEKVPRAEIARKNLRKQVARPTLARRRPPCPPFTCVEDADVLPKGVERT